MNQPFDPASFDPAALADPNVDQATLAQLAQARPDLRQAIALHPNCYPALREWIGQQAPPAPAPPQQRPAPAGPGAQGPQGQGAQGPQGQGAQQIADGAKQMFGDAQQAFQGALGAQTKATGPARILGWIPAVLAAASLLGIISLFLPVVSVGSMSINYFSSYADHEGVFLLILFLLTIAGSILVFIRPGLLWARIVTGIVGVITAIFGLIDGFGNAGVASGTLYASPGAGAVMLGIFSIIVILAAIAIFLPPSKFGIVTGLGAGTGGAPPQGPGNAPFNGPADGPANGPAGDPNRGPGQNPYGPQG